MIAPKPQATGQACAALQNYWNIAESYTGNHTQLAIAIVAGIAISSPFLYKYFRAVATTTEPYRPVITTVRPTTAASILDKVKPWLIIIVALLAVAGGGFYFYQYVYKKNELNQEEEDLDTDTKKKDKKKNSKKRKKSKAPNSAVSSNESNNSKLGSTPLKVSPKAIGSAKKKRTPSSAVSAASKESQDIISSMTRKSAATTKKKPKRAVASVASNEAEANSSAAPTKQSSIAVDKQAAPIDSNMMKLPKSPKVERTVSSVAPCAADWQHSGQQYFSDADTTGANQAQPRVTHNLGVGKQTPSSAVSAASKESQDITPSTTRKPAATTKKKPKRAVTSVIPNESKAKSIAAPAKQPSIAVDKQTAPTDSNTGTPSPNTMKLPKSPKVERTVSSVAPSAAVWQYSDADTTSATQAPNESKATSSAAPEKQSSAQANNQSHL